MIYLFPQLKNGFLYLILSKIPGFWQLVAVVAGFVLIAAIAYLCGSFNSAVFLSKRIFGYDIREYGSGNAGMTNMFRTFGKKAGILTLAGDVLKALIALIIAYLILGERGQYVAGFFCIIGHVFPCF